MRGLLICRPARSHLIYTVILPDQLRHLDFNPIAAVGSVVQPGPEIFVPKNLGSVDESTRMKPSIARFLSASIYNHNSGRDS